MIVDAESEHLSVFLYDADNIALCNDKNPHILDVKMTIEILFWVFAATVAVMESYFMTGTLLSRKKLLEKNESGNYTPSVSVIMPCRGIDHKFKDGIKAVLNQNYAGKWEFLAVVDDMKDPCVKILKKFSGVRIIVNKNYDSTPKNSAMITGFEHSKCEVLVLLDS